MSIFFVVGGHLLLCLFICSSFVKKKQNTFLVKDNAHTVSDFKDIGCSYMSKATYFFCSTAIVKRVISRVFEPIIKRAVNILQDNEGREDTEEIDTIEYRDLKVGIMHI